jgi:alanine racemase
MHRCWVEVSLDQIARNYTAIRRVAGEQVELMPVVKADAYRHGAPAVARTLEQASAHWLAVSNLQEGIVLREAGIRARILVMAERVASGGTAWREYRLTPAVHSLEELTQLEPGLPFHLKVDSGMGRLGVRAENSAIVEALYQSGRATEMEGVMTHFASSADFEGEQTKQQQRAFDSCVAALRAAGIAPQYVHAASTNPLHFGVRESWGNLARPGYAIYGFVSEAKGQAPARLLEVAPALSWKAEILLVKDVEAGAAIGYGAQFRAPHRMRIGILGAGYADGIPHRLSNRGKVIAAGQLTPILGAVSMDVTTVDLSHAPQLQAGDAVTLLGREGEASIDAREMARAAGTIAYSVLCGISARVRRVYV